MLRKKISGRNGNGKGIGRMAVDEYGLRPKTTENRQGPRNPCAKERTPAEFRGSHAFIVRHGPSRIGLVSVFPRGFFSFMHTLGKVQLHPSHLSFGLSFNATGPLGLVISVEHTPDLLRAGLLALSSVTALAQRVARAMRAEFGATGVVVLQASGADAGQSVPHLHFHVVLCWWDDGTTHRPTRLSAHPFEGDPHAASASMFE